VSNEIQWKIEGCDSEDWPQRESIHQPNSAFTGCDGIEGDACFCQASSGLCEASKGLFTARHLAPGKLQWLAGFFKNGSRQLIPLTEKTVRHALENCGSLVAREFLGLVEANFGTLKGFL